jgi:hypothetical protein
VTTSKSYTDSQISITNGNIALKVAKTDYTGNTIASLINQTATTVGISANKISLSANDSITLAINNSASNTLSSANSNAQSYASTAVNSLQIGGTNLALGTTISQTVTGTGGSNQCTNIYNIDFSKVAGKQITLSFDAVSTVTSGTFSIQWNASPWGSFNITPITASNTKQRYSFTSTQPSSGTPTGISIRMDGLIGNVTISNLKIELGNKATDWSPAPGDSPNNSNIISSINLSPETVTINASKLNLNGYVTVTNLGTAGATIINGSNITTGSISANRINGGTLILGGSGNGSGTMKLQDFNNNAITYMDNLGIHTNNIYFTNTPNSDDGNCYIEMETDNKTLIMYNQDGDTIIENVGHTIHLEGTILSDSIIKYGNGHHALEGASNMGSFVFASQNTYLGVSDNIGESYAISITASDIRLKENITATTVNALEQLNQVGIFAFDWKNGKPHQELGVISQDLFAINTNWTVDVPQGNGEIYKQPDIARIYPYLIKGIQELDEKIQKSSVTVKTEHYGNKEMYSPRCPKKINWDIGMNTLRNKMCIVTIDPEFLETIDTDMGYQVKPWGYGEGNVWVESYEMYPTYFIVRGNVDNIDFGYEIFVKQKESEEVMV